MIPFSPNTNPRDGYTRPQKPRAVHDPPQRTGTPIPFGSPGGQQLLLQEPFQHTHTLRSSGLPSPPREMSKPRPTSSTDLTRLQPDPVPSCRTSRSPRFLPSSAHVCRVPPNLFAAAPLRDHITPTQATSSDCKHVAPRKLR